MLFFRLFLCTVFFLSAYSCASSKDECVVLLCNKKYFPKFLSTLEMLVTKGRYRGDICLVIGDDLAGSDLLNSDLIKKHRVLIKHFPDLRFPDSFLEKVRDLPNLGKLFQYHKLHLFHSYFKRWRTILYIDCGMKIYADIRPIINVKKPNTLLAHSDAFPSYGWKLRDQFNKKEESLYRGLDAKFSLDIDYFQTTMMLYDTNIIEEDTFKDLYSLALQYPISLTNDQGIIALYFTNVKSVWQQISLKNEKIFFYDYLKRNIKSNYIMLKG